MICGVCGPSNEACRHIVGDAGWTKCQNCGDVMRDAEYHGPGKCPDSVYTLQYLRGVIAELRIVISLAVDSQGWSGNDPGEERWTDFYAKARAAIEKYK